MAPATLEPATQTEELAATYSNQSTANIVSDADHPPQSDASTFPFMKLPPGLRLNVFDHVLTEFTTTRQSEVADLEAWHAWDQWPDNHLSTLLSLLLTSKKINAQVKKLWEDAYADKCIFYFWDMAEFYRVANSATALGAPYRNMKFVLRAKEDRWNGDDEAAFMSHEAVKLVLHESGRPYSMMFRILTDLGTCQYWVTIGANISITRKQDSLVYVRHDYAPRHKYTYSLHGYHSGEHRLEDPICQYLQMHGEIGKVSWGDYNPAVDYAKPRLFREWAKRGFPTAHLEKKDILHSIHTPLLFLLLEGPRPFSCGEATRSTWRAVPAHELCPAYTAF